MTSVRISRIWGTILLTITICSLSLPAYAKYSGGTGEPNDPYQIATAADLMLLGETPADYDKHFILSADIDLDPNLPGRKVFEKAVIAPDTDPGDGGRLEGPVFTGTSFTGVFDGDGHTISNLTITGKDYVGMFGRLGRSLPSVAEVKNLGVVDAHITGSGCYAGGLVGNNNDGKVTQCYSTGAVTADGNDVGGLVGYNSRGTVTQCYNTGAVNGNGRVGGLVGRTGGRTVTHCYSTGAVSGHVFVGGLVGYNDGEVICCYSTGAVSGNEYVGGLVGSDDSLRVTHSVWDMQTSGLAGSAGGVGLTTTEMMDPYMLGLNGFANDPNWVLDPGRDYPRLAWQGTPGQIIPEPLIDWLAGDGTAESPYRVDTANQLVLLGRAPILWDKHFVLGADIDLNPNLSGCNVFTRAVIQVFAGAFDGNSHVISNLTITDMDYCYECYRVGLFGILDSGSEVKNLGVVDVNINGSSNWVGGLVGINYGKVTQCYSTGFVSGHGFVGGLVGENGGVVTLSYSTAAVAVIGGKAGGLVGDNWRTVSRCYSEGAVSAGSDVGGLVGDNAYGTVTQCYNTGAVSAGSDVGGLVGDNDHGTVTQCYNTGAVSGKDYVGGLVGHNGSVGSITGSYSTGTVGGSYTVGGLVGSNEGDAVTQCYSTGAVSGDRSVGGLVGSNTDPPWGGKGVVACFWDIETSGQAASAGGTGKTTAEMRDPNTFIAARWDFVGQADGPHDVWAEPENGGYPMLCWQFRAGSGLPDFSGGTGEPNDPYQIATAADLIALGETPEDYDKHFILTADIDLDPNLPGRKVFDKAVIAPDTEPHDFRSEFQGTSFTGVFDGNGHIISHLTVIGRDYLGLFGQLESRAEVRNLGVLAVTITGSGNNIGGLAGQMVWTCHVMRCYSSGVVSGGSDVGGLVGLSGALYAHDAWGWGGTISECYSTAETRGGDWGVGGLVGYNLGTVTNCYSTGVVSGRGSVGGLVGSYGGDVTASFWDMQTSGQTTSAGGRGKTTAEMQSRATFLAWGSCGNAGTWTIDEGQDYPRLSWENRPGELIASASSLRDVLTGEGTEQSPYLIYTAEELSMLGLFLCEWGKSFKLMADIDLSAFDGKDGRLAFPVVGTSSYAPFTGVFDGAGHTISRLTVKGGDSYLGLFGCLASGAQVRDVGIVDVNIVGSGGFVGGMVGCNAGGTVMRCWSTGVVSGTYSVGGLMGYNDDDGTVSNSYSTGAVNGTEYVGGLVGCNLGTVTQCYSTGSVSGNSDVGGLVGANGVYDIRGGTVTQCYSTGAVSGKDYVGGLVGYNRYDGSVATSYSRSSVTGTGHLVGGLVGCNGGVVTQCFWNVETSGQTWSFGGRGKTTAEMQTAKTFLDAGWDFVGETANGVEDLWWILEGKDYPRLWWETK